MSEAELCSEPGSLRTVEGFLQDTLSSQTIDLLLSSPAVQITELLRRIYVDGRFWVSTRRRAARRGTLPLVKAFAPVELRSGVTTVEQLNRLLLYADSFPINDPLFSLASYLAQQTGYDPTDLQGIRVSHARRILSNFDSVFAQALELLALLRPLICKGEVVLMPTDAAMYRTLEYYSPGGSENDISDSDDPLALSAAVSTVGSESWLQDFWDDDDIDSYTRALEVICDLGSLLVYDDLGFQPFILGEPSSPFESNLVRTTVDQQVRLSPHSRNALELGLPAAARADLKQIVRLRTSDEFGLFRERYSDLLSRIRSELPLEKEQFDLQFYELASDLLRRDIERLTREVQRRSVWREIVAPGALLVGGTVLDFAVFHLPSASSLATGTVAADVAMRGRKQRQKNRGELYVLNLLTSGLGQLRGEMPSRVDEILLGRHGR